MNWTISSIATRIDRSELLTTDFVDGFLDSPGFAQRIKATAPAYAHKSDVHLAGAYKDGDVLTWHAGQSSRRFPPLPLEGLEWISVTIYPERRPPCE